MQVVRLVLALPLHNLDLFVAMQSDIPKYSVEIARDKMRQWCDKAERCHWDVREKLIAWRIRATDRENIISHLIEMNLLNEQRFAEAFVHDKFYLNKWGTKKVEQQLRKKGISERNIQHALQQIGKNENVRMLKELIKRKEPQLTGLPFREKNIKLARYLISKGFDSDMVWQVLQSGD